MNDKYFLDTNILIYSFDHSAPKKREIACTLIETAMRDGKGCISTQVIQEFLNVATRKFNIPFSCYDCKRYLNNVLNPLCEVFPDHALYEGALDIQATTQYSFYDSLILTSAKRAHCSILYTEDLHDGHQIEKLTIKNPFH